MNVGDNGMSNCMYCNKLLVADTETTHICNKRWGNYCNYNCYAKSLPSVESSCEYCHKLITTNSGYCSDVCYAQQTNS